MPTQNTTHPPPWHQSVSAEKNGETTVPQALSLEKTSPATSERFWQGKDELAGSRFAMMEIRPGFELWHYHGKFDHDVLMSFQDSPPMIAFSFCFSGRSVHDYLSDGHSFEVFPQSQQVAFYPFPDFTTHMAGDMAFNRLSVLLSPEQFMECFDWNMDALSPALQQLVEQGCVTPFLMPPVRIDFGAQKRLQRVKELLENRLNDPPSLSELARETAMSAPKLNKCFRQLYGTTVFEYLRQQRFNQAKAMLEQGLSVTEASLAVGYESLASFSIAFKKRFGYAPSRYLRQK